jgi:hypothetical protein
MSLAPNTPTPSRRRLLAGSGLVAALATVGLPALAASVRGQPDPVLALYAKWRMVEDEEAIVGKRHSELRAVLVQRHGEPTGFVSAQKLWGDDHIFAESSAACERSNDLCDESVGLIDAMMETPATSLEGLRCKFIVALDVWKFIEKPGVEAEYHDDMTVAFLRDAVRVLGGSVAA